MGSVFSSDMEMEGKGRERCFEDNAVLFAGEMPRVGNQAQLGGRWVLAGHLRGCWMCWVLGDECLSMEAWGFW